LIYIHLEFIRSNESNNDISPPKKSSPIDRLRRTLSFRNRKKENISTSTSKNGNKNKTNANKPLPWQDDEKSVRVGMRSFSVKVK